ncbi:MAG: NAD-dependent deacylase [Bacteroidetes bacterium]|nr:NAD-dependent deacylase [Bacteroidia bacterium]MBN8696519.1 NAD-dependent deacylase [Bacteroidota bacterium]
MKQKLVVFTGAGISAESGIRTFRDSNGLWEEYNISEVATPQAWEKNKALVLEFYNKRRKQIIDAQPNDAHKALVELEKHFDVQIITQNIDDLHERAGSKKVLHLHGEITKSRSSIDPSLIYLIKGADIKLGEKCEKGSQLRPHIVWFGEMVPMMDQACFLAEKADIFAVIGTSMVVYPAAGLIEYTQPSIPKYLIDPSDVKVNGIQNLRVIKEKASIGVPMLAKELLST